MMHCRRDALPELIATFFVNGLVANDGKFMNTRRDKNQHRITVARLVHAEPMKLSLRRNQGIALQLATLDQNPNLAGGFRFRAANRFGDPIVLKFAEEFSRSHFVTSLIRRRRRRNCRRHR